MNRETGNWDDEITSRYDTSPLEQSANDDMWGMHIMEPEGLIDVYNEFAEFYMDTIWEVR